MRLLWTDLSAGLVMREFPCQLCDPAADLASFESKTETLPVDKVIDLHLQELASDGVVPVSPYAILSHTWSAGEVLFADVEGGTAHARPQYPKLRSAAQAALKDGFKWIWIDTCCIDKGKSAELSEAINSMFAWYQAAGKCYAYLADVPAEVDPFDEKSAFARARWWRRGWTLQELLAPKIVIFYDAKWDAIGDKMSLHEPISKITRIDADILVDANVALMRAASVAKRMSWAAHRETTRPEDRAYSLMGIFDVNMPMLYGEGTKAFRRLQEEIMRNSSDQSLFAWTEPSLRTEQLFHPSSSDPPLAYLQAVTKMYKQHGLLADSPSAFAASGDIVSHSAWQDTAPYEMTNQGVRLQVALMPSEEGLFIAALNCAAPFSGGNYLAILLLRLRDNSQQYARVMTTKTFTVNTLGAVKTIYVEHVIPPAVTVFKRHQFRLRSIRGKGIHHLVATKARELGDEEIAHYCPFWNPEQLPMTYYTIDLELDYFRARAAGFSEDDFFRSVPGNRLAAALLIKRDLDDQCFVLLLGSAGRLAGIGVLGPVRREDFDKQSLDELEKCFAPHPLLIPLIMGTRSVRVDATCYTRGHIKVSAVDIYITDSENERATARAEEAMPPDSSSLRQTSRLLRLWRETVSNWQKATKLLVS